MKKISRSTTFAKRVFPLIWCGGLVIVALAAFTQAAVHDERWIVGVAVPVFMAAFGFVLMRKLVWDLADEVHDGGHFLLVRKGSEEERIALNNIMNVSVSTNVNPARITLRLVKPGRFGPEVAFSAVSRMSFDPSAKNPVAEDLIVRAYEARTRTISR